MQILKERPPSIDPMSLEEMADRIRQAGKGMRHPTAQALVSYAYFCMHRIEDIANVLKPAFVDCFESSERRNAAKEFAEFIKYCENGNTPRSIGGIEVRSVPAPEIEP